MIWSALGTCPSATRWACGAGMPKKIVLIDTRNSGQATQLWCSVCFWYRQHDIVIHRHWRQELLVCMLTPFKAQSAHCSAGLPHVALRSAACWVPAWRYLWQKQCTISVSYLCSAQIEFPPAGQPAMNSLRSIGRGRSLSALRRFYPGGQCHSCCGERAHL